MGGSPRERAVSGKKQENIHKDVMFSQIRFTDQDPQRAKINAISSGSNESLSFKGLKKKKKNTPRNTSTESMTGMSARKANML